MGYERKVIGSDRGELRAKDERLERKEMIGGIDIIEPKRNPSLLIGRPPSDASRAENIGVGRSKTPRNGGGGDGIEVSHDQNRIVGVEGAELI